MNNNSFQKIQELSKVDVVNVLNLVFSDYVLRMHWTLESFERDVRENNISLSESFVMKAEGIHVGIVLLSFREKRARIDLMGVIPSFRREGVGFKMVDEAVRIAKWKGCDRIILEVPEKDKRAIDFYEKFGFRHRRELITFFIRRPGTGDFSIKESDSGKVVEYALYVMDKYKRSPEWEREPASFHHLERYNFDTVIDEQGREIAYCIWQERDSVFYVKDCGPTRAASFKEAIGAICSIAKSKNLTPLFPTVPDSDPLFTEVQEFEPEILLKQSEMILKIH
ncbi:MAG: GNAT family N-acetyltransferase [Kosmotogaceae bacterium]|nr:GNAT family N-acetyltransferase [Kosmotogaceae bacterium]